MLNVNREAMHSNCLFIDDSMRKSNPGLLTACKVGFTNGNTHHSSEILRAETNARTSYTTSLYTTLGKERSTAFLF